MRRVQNIVFYALAVFFLFLRCSDPVEKEDTSILVSHSPGSLDAGGEGVSPEAQKADVETVMEAGQAIISAGQQLIGAKRKRDSIQLAGREKMFAYQLGLPAGSEKLVAEAYVKLSDREGVCVFKKPGNEFLLIKYEAKNEEELQAGLEEYRSERGHEVTGSIKIIDLMRECGKNRKPVLNKKIRSRHNKVSINCLTCSK